MKLKFVAAGLIVTAIAVAGTLMVAPWNNNDQDEQATGHSHSSDTAHDDVSHEVDAKFVTETPCHLRLIQFAQEVFESTSIRQITQRVIAWTLNCRKISVNCLDHVGWNETRHDQKIKRVALQRGWGFR